jgi:hypothetical protein
VPCWLRYYGSQAASGRPVLACWVEKLQIWPASSQVRSWAELSGPMLASCLSGGQRTVNALPRYLMGPGSSGRRPKMPCTTITGFVSGILTRLHSPKLSNHYSCAYPVPGLPTWHLLVRFGGVSIITWISVGNMSSSKWPAGRYDSV